MGFLHVPIRSAEDFDNNVLELDCAHNSPRANTFHPGRAFKKCNFKPAENVEELEGIYPCIMTSETGTELGGTWRSLTWTLPYIYLYE